MARSRKTVCVGCKWHEKDGVSIFVKAMGGEVPRKDKGDILTDITFANSFL